MILVILLASSTNSTTSSSLLPASGWPARTSTSMCKMVDFFDCHCLISYLCMVLIMKCLEIDVGGEEVLATS